MVYSNANRTIAMIQPFRRGASTTAFKNSGKWYVELAYSGSPSNVYFGVSEQSSGYIQNNPASSGVYWRKDGNAYANGKSFGIYGVFGAGDVIGIALDMDNKLVSFFKNCAKVFTAPVPLASGSYAPFETTEQQGSATLNAGNVNFTCPVPAGYRAGLY